MWSLDEAASRPLVKHALDVGITFFDTANLYTYGSSAEIPGRASKDFADRDDVVIATNCGTRCVRGPTARGSPVRRSWPRSTTASPGSAPTTSILLAREEEREMIPLRLDEGVGTVVWSPLGRGRLARPWADARSTARSATDGSIPGYATA